MDRLVLPGLTALAFALALIQRPGEATSDTQIGLHVDPVSFLGDVAAAWSPTEDLGHVQGGQYGGYLFPMGPFFALGRVLGLSPWLVHRLWLGLVLFVAAWGIVRLMDALAGRPRGAAHLIAGLLFLLNPYVAVFTARTSVTLLGYAALPWLLLCVYRGLGAPRSWWWPAAFALAVACTGGGVNAAVTAWVLLGPLLLALFAWLTREVGGRALLSFGWRTVLLTGLGAVWWVIPTLVQARHGVDFLRFTEQPGTIWSTTSLPESLRLMGYWISYLGVGYGGRLRPLFGDGAVFLFAWPVVIAGLLVPGLVLGGFALLRRSRAAAGAQPQRGPGGREPAEPGERERQQRPRLVGRAQELQRRDVVVGEVHRAPQRRPLREAGDHHHEPGEREHEQKRGCPRAPQQRERAEHDRRHEQPGEHHRPGEQEHGSVAEQRPQPPAVADAEV